MLAAVYRGIDDVRVEVVPVPEIRPGEVLVRIRACGVCGTDLKKIHFGLVPPPRIFGHEMAGEIAAVGEGVDEWRVGDRVAVMHHVPCLGCHYCLQRSFAQCPQYRKTGTTAGFEPAGGGFAEYIRVMDWVVERGMLRIPPDIGLDEASLIEPVNTCLKAAHKAFIRPRDSVLIIGQGPIGLIFTRIAAFLQAVSVTTDTLQSRRELSVRWGASESLAPYTTGVQQRVHDVTDGRGADVTILTVPNAKLIPEALEFTRPGGKVLLFAQTRVEDEVSIDSGVICAQEKDLVGSYSSDISLMGGAAKLIFSRFIDGRQLITDRFKLEDVCDAISLASHPTDSSLKVIVEP